MIFDYRDRTGEPPARAATSVDEPPETDPEITQSVSPEEDPTPSASPSETEPARDPKKKKRVRLITEGVTIQVLNGSNDPAAGEAMEQELTELGFQVVAVESTSKAYQGTTVFWCFPDAMKAGEALAEKRDWVADEKPANLADTVSLHVVVGQDFL